MKIIAVLLTFIGFIAEIFLAFLWIAAGDGNLETKVTIISVFGPLALLGVIGPLILLLEKLKSKKVI